MPNIPRAERTQTIPGTSGNVKRDVASAGQEWGELSKAADTMTGVLQERAIKLKNQADYTQTVEVSTNADIAIRLRSDEYKKLEGKAAENVYDNEMKWGDSYIKGILKDIKDPKQNILWTVPEGGGGPNYSGM